MSRRVVITGMGAITPVGNDVDTFWNSISNGKVGIDTITAFDVTDFKAKLAAEVKDFNPEDYIERREARRMDRFCQFALAASKQAVEDSKLNFEDENMDKIGVIVGCGIGGIGTIEEQEIKLNEKGPNRVSPMLIPMIISNMAAGNIAIKYGAKGICTTIVTACASANNAIGEAFHKIKENHADIIFAGGTEAAITPISIAGFISLTALSKSTDPKRASIPFDAERNGFVMGEGSAMLILEEYEHAVKRNAKIYAEVVGYGATCDAYHITAPSPDGEGGARSMLMAIEDAGIKPEEVSYINAHGTSTQANEKTETASFKKVFGENAYKIPISSTKSMTGHLLGAAGAIEAVVCVKALQDDFVPPTVGLQVSDPDCDLDYVPNVGRKTELQFALSNSLGFGGHNAALVFKKWRGR
ncbi:3-oxoacyl-[acyl-carrier-protein] synthase II [Clostridium acidisoli DSM 12555]|uniref:3-oxoacyl-[acyl-carrier-protein] synthase 2 n=1 Tax=Clostridium acidisoli DSM 12555 TaxID=1121291 RepID=A0A1W1XQQ1_9CLOT|nr:beta-ketoacyl-ACP synthase II [Clostridium acidisoli]SMC26236.1 3-oxoacyl-[acyl-carrier-protein] synthase II [Clostridium acidisoli DSM 12555]